MGRRLSAALVAALGTLAAAGGAMAITFGQPDGGAHPYVGALVATAPGVASPKLFCSGSLVAPRVFVTAAHCVAAIEAKPGAQAFVTFDEHYTDAATLIPGTMVADPQFTGRRDRDPHDLAVVLLAADAPVAPVALAPLGTLDGLSKRDLRGLRFVDVGYGVHETGVPWDASRWNAVSGDGSIHDGWLELSQRQKQGFGGTCTGDSGGPELLGDLQVAITITGDPGCERTNVDLRLDTAGARGFLAPYLALR